MFYIGNHKDRIVSFTIKKEIECRTSSIAENQFNSLTELQEKKNTFGEICIPNFTYGKNDNFVWYESDYIKGRIIKPEDMKIVWKECVLREDSFTLSNYDRTNYIKCGESSKIYFIDLNDCRHMTIEERMASWKKAGY
tara:strand:- start:1473 stop:1886 length:414 start_codon:yes stop_codon:yes gene_type:complete